MSALQAFLVEGVYGGQLTWVWAADADDAFQQCLAEMDENSEYSAGSNEVRYYILVEDLIKKLQEFLDKGAPS